MNQVTIRYHGHACFTLEKDGWRTVLDPYKDGAVPGLPPLRLQAEAVLCSHGHGDHSYVQAVQLQPSERPAPYRLSCLDSWHDDCSGAQRGPNRIHLFDFGSLRVAHLGDQGCMPEREQLFLLEGVDCLLLPVGGFYTIDAEQAYALVQKLQPRVVIPMHYRTDTTGFDVISHIDDFAGRFAAVQQGGSSLVLDRQLPRQIHILHCEGETA